MSERRSPRTLRDVSHLFLSGAETERREPRFGSASIWLAAAGASTNRAHFAAGTAEAFARQGMCVSLLEASSCLPNIGYYFGMEPEGYLAPAINRSALVSGTWNGAIRYCFSADLASFEGYHGEALPRAVPHVIIIAFSYPREREAARRIAALQGVSALLADEGEQAGCQPDAIITAGCGQSAGRARTIIPGMREIFPHAALFLVTDDPGAGRVREADESLLVPRDLRSSWARRVPPADGFFGELASGLLQVVSQRRRRSAGHAANG